jgi:hypothetical protein
MAGWSYRARARAVPCAITLVDVKTLGRRVTNRLIPVNREAAPFEAASLAPEEETRGSVLSHRSPRMKAVSDTRDDVSGMYASPRPSPMALPSSRRQDLRRPSR